MPSHVTTLYASNAKFKQLWAGTLTSDPSSARYLDLGKRAGDGLIQARSTSLDEHIMKLCELQEGLSDDGSAWEKAMVASLIADVEAWQESPGGSATPMPDPGPPPPAPKGPTSWTLGATTLVHGPQGPAPRSGGAAASVQAEPVQATQPVAPKIWVDRRSRPVHVDGQVYPSITAAAKALGRSYESVRSETVRSRL